MTKKALNRPFFHLLLILILGLIAYSNTFTVPFHFDDTHAIVENPRISKLSSVPSLFFDIKGSIASRPLTLATFALNYRLGGLDTLGYHVFNLALHLANGVLLYLLMLKAAPLIKPDMKSPEGLALMSSLLFTLHPLHTETVTYVVSRSELLGAFFYLSGMLVFIRAATAGGRAYLYIAMLFITSLLGMASRESFVTFPFVLLLFDFLFVSKGSLKETLKRLKVHLPVFASLAYLALLLLRYDPGRHAGFGVETITPADYILTQLRVHWTYLRLILLPFGQVVDYDYPASTSFFELRTFAAFMGDAALWTAGIIALRKRPAVSFCLLWFLVTLLPSTLVPVVDVMFEHRAYLPSIGVFVLMALALWKARQFLAFKASL
jgi:hypothetical protein